MGCLVSIKHNSAAPRNPVSLCNFYVPCTFYPAPFYKRFGKICDTRDTPLPLATHAVGGGASRFPKSREAKMVKPAKAAEGAVETRSSSLYLESFYPDIKSCFVRLNRLNKEVLGKSLAA